jgi:plastocyanin
MHPRSASFSALSSLLAVLFLSIATPSAFGDVNVTVTDYAFTPRDVVISIGETVTWTWVDGFHTTTNGANSDDPNAGLLWDSFLFSGQKTASFTFATAGQYPYFCRFHDALDMKGTVKVMRYRVSAVEAKTGPGAQGAAGDPSDPAEPTSWGLIKSLYR